MGETCTKPHLKSGPPRPISVCSLFIISRTSVYYFQKLPAPGSSPSRVFIGINYYKTVFNNTRLFENGATSAKYSQKRNRAICDVNHPDLNPLSVECCTYEI